MFDSQNQGIANSVSLMLSRGGAFHPGHTQGQRRECSRTLSMPDSTAPCVRWHTEDRLNVQTRQQRTDNGWTGTSSIAQNQRGFVAVVRTRAPRRTSCSTRMSTSNTAVAKACAARAKRVCWAAAVERGPSPAAGAPASMETTHGTGDTRGLRTAFAGTSYTLQRDSVRGGVTRRQSGQCDA